MRDSLTAVGTSVRLLSLRDEDGAAVQEMPSGEPDVSAESSEPEEPVSTEQGDPAAEEQSMEPVSSEPVDPITDQAG